MAVNYYKLQINLEKETVEIFLKSKGQTEQANYVLYSADLKHLPKAKGVLTLTEITKKEYDKFFGIVIR